MAAPSITLDSPKPGRLGTSAFGVLSGTGDITAYDTAHPAVTAITGHFIAGGALRVMVTAITDQHMLLAWDSATNSFLSYSALNTETTNGTDAGEFAFIAVGQMAG